MHINAKKLITIFNIMVITGIILNFAFNRLVHNGWPPRFVKSIGFSIFKFRADLSDKQSAAIQKSREEFFKDVEVLNADIARTKSELVNTLVSGNASPDSIEKIRKNLHEKQGELQKRMIKQMLTVRSELDPNQQEVFFKMIQKGLNSSRMNPLTENY